MLDALADLQRGQRPFRVHNNRFICETKVEEVSALLDAIDIRYEILGGHVLQINIEQDLCSLLTEEHALNRDSKLLSSPFAILTLDGDLYLYRNEADSQFHNGSSQAFITRVNNAISYWRLFDHLTKKQQLEDVLHDGQLNTTTREIILYSPVNGIFKISYSKSPPIFNIDIQDNCVQIISHSSSPYTSFFINSLFVWADRKYSTDLTKLILGSKSLCEIIRRDYNLFQKKFNFENFRDSLFKEKDKYFLAIREVVSKIFGQLIGVPISISAATFASYKLEADPATLYLILIGFITYGFFYICIQFMYLKDLKEIRSDFEYNFGRIKSESGLDENIISRENTILIDKFRRTKLLGILLIGVVTVLSVLVSIYIYRQIQHVAIPDVTSPPSPKFLK